MVDGLHGCGAGAEVGVQGVVAPQGGVTGREVGVDVPPAKAIDRLLGVADQNQGGVVSGLWRGGFVNPVDPLEDTVLGRVGILEFVDHGHGELFAKALCQGLAVLTS